MTSTSDNDSPAPPHCDTAIPPQLRPLSPAGALSKKQQRNWALVLEAKGIPCRLQQTDQGRALLVPPQFLGIACAELRTWEQENRNWPPAPPQSRRFHENTASTIWVFITLVVFHNLTIGSVQLFGSAAIDWVDAGAAKVAAIKAGQWWRLITALTLHSGMTHLLGNVAAGIILCTRLCRIIGSGWGWFSVVLSGAIGNLLNAAVQTSAHSSIGASTAVFAAVGLLGILNMLHYRRGLWKRWPLPIAAALALLALLGAGGENTDVGAHLFGFVAGIMVGLGSHLLFSWDKLPREQLNYVLAFLTPALVGWAWWLAVN